MKASSMWQLYFTQWKAQVSDNYIVLSERLKYVTVRFYSMKGSGMIQLGFTQWKLKCVKIRFYSVKDSSMWQLDFTQWKAQVYDN